MPKTQEFEDHDDPARRVLSLRLPRSLHEQLKQVKPDDQSLNEVIGNAIAAFIEKPELGPGRLPDDISQQLALGAVQMGYGAVPFLKSIASECASREQWALACVIWAACARLVAHYEGAQNAAMELSRTADVAWNNYKRSLAMALWREALELDSDNLEAANRLGQELHRLASKNNDISLYREAETYLKRVVQFDNRALLFHGWSAYFVNKEEGHLESAQRALDEVVEAMKAWAFGNRSSSDYRSWKHQLSRLADIDMDRATSLWQFENRHAYWLRDKDKVAAQNLSRQMSDEGERTPDSQESSQETEGTAVGLVDS